MMAFSAFYPLLLASVVALVFLQQGSSKEDPTCINQLKDKDNVFEHKTFNYPYLYFYNYKKKGGQKIVFSLTVKYGSKEIKCGENVTYASVLTQPTLSMPSQLLDDLEKEKRFNFFTCLFWESSKGKPTSIIPPYALWLVYDIPRGDFRKGWSGKSGKVCFDYNIPLPIIEGRTYVFQLQGQDKELEDFKCPTFRLSPFNVTILKNLLPIDETTLKSSLPPTAETMLQNLPPLKLDNLTSSFFNESSLELTEYNGTSLKHPVCAMYFKIPSGLLGLLDLASLPLPAVDPPLKPLPVKTPALK